MDPAFQSFGSLSFISPGMFIFIELLQQEFPIPESNLVRHQKSGFRIIEYCNIKTFDK